MEKIVIAINILKRQKKKRKRHEPNEFKAARTIGRL